MRLDNQKCIDNNAEYKSSIDITKLIMAILVIGIHTQPFAFNTWLDRGFGIITRTCVPFFFVASSYLFWRSNHQKPIKYVKRIMCLYFIWSVIYLPFDIGSLKGMSFPEIIKYYFWIGNGHELWYLLASVIGFLIVLLLSKVLPTRAILVISIAVLIIGCLLSTWAPIINAGLGDEVYKSIGYRNGLFYAFPYMTLGMALAKYERKWFQWKDKTLWMGLFFSLFLLVLESFVFVVHFNTGHTVLWLSVFPLSCFLFMIISKMRCKTTKNTAVFIRNMSTLIYLSQSMFFNLLFGVQNTIRFLLVALLATSFSAVIVFASRKKYFRFLRYLY